MLSGLAQLNIELTSTCDKTHRCGFCGHQDPSVNPITYGDMDYGLLQFIRLQVQPGIVISFHRDGDPTAYPQLSDALRLFRGFTTSLVTHGTTLSGKAQAIIGNVTSLTISAFRGDVDRSMQIQSVTDFLKEKGDRAPQVHIKIVGDMSPDELAPYEALGVRLIHRLIHIPISNAKYAHRNPTVPEVGVCLDALHRPTVDWRGDLFLCNRLDADRHGYLGSLVHESLENLWNGPTRLAMVAAHTAGRRDLANPLCATCKHWGVASA